MFLVHLQSTGAVCRSRAPRALCGWALPFTHACLVRLRVDEGLEKCLTKNAKKNLTLIEVIPTTEAESGFKMRIQVQNLCQR